MEAGAVTADAAAGAGLVGRGYHLTALEDAFAASRGEAVTMLVHGPPGMGKTALLRRFLDGVVEAHGALLLEGRAHACPRGPHDALAPLMDALAAHLAGWSPADAEALRSPDVAALARLFPVLRRVPAVAAAPPLEDAPDPREVRRRAAAALRLLIGRVAARGPLVLALDDLHLADVESTSLLFDLVVPPEAPRLLLVVAYRRESAGAVGLVTALLQRMAHGDPAGDVRELLVGPLAPREARALARALLPDDRAEDGDAPASIDRAAGGSPSSIRALAREKGALDSRLDALPAAARALLEIVAAAGRPTPLAVALDAAADLDDADAALLLLLEEELVRVDEADDVEPARALVREAVLARAAPGALAGHHLRLARALADRGAGEPEELLFHLDAGGDAAGAREQAERAAARAAQGLAWSRAAALYRRAALLAPAAPSAPDARPLLVAMGHALAHDGRSAEAGRAYLEACAGAPPAEALELRRLAFEALICAGEVEAGLAAARELVAAVGLSLPATPPRAAASLLYRRARLSLRGLDFEERPGTASPAELARADVCGAVGDRLHEVDLVRGADFQARHLLCALDTGDPDRLALALASAGIAAAMEGRRAGRDRAERLVDQASAVAERADRPLALAWAAAARAGATFHQHRFADALAQSERAVELLRCTCAGVGWQLGVLVGRWLLPALHLLGHAGELVFRLPAWLDELAALGAHAEVSSLRAGAVPRLLLARDQPTDARRESADAARALLSYGWPAPRWRAAAAGAAAWLYQGEGRLAHQELSAGWPELSRSSLLRLESVRLEALHLRAACAVAAAGRDGDGGRLLGDADRDARALRREGSPLAEALGGGLLASVALARGQEEKALGLFGDAEAAFGALGMSVHEAAMRRRRGELLMGEDGRALTMEADGVMWARGVLRPDRLAAVLAP